MSLSGTSGGHSPYLTGKPTSIPFGRSDLLDKTAQLLEVSGCPGLVLHGERRMGKTSLLQATRQHLSHSGTVTAFLDLMPRATKPFSQVVFELSHRLCVELGVPPPARDQFDSEGQYFHEHFLPSIERHVPRRGALFLLDEFDAIATALPNTAGGQLCSYLLTHLNGRHNIRLIVVLGRPPDDTPLASARALGALARIHVSFLSPEANDLVVRQSELDHTLTWTDDAVTAVWKWTRGHPYLTQLICHEVWQYVHSWSTAPTPLADFHAVHEMLNGAQEQAAGSLFARTWDALPATERLVLSAVAASTPVANDVDFLLETLQHTEVRAGELAAAVEHLKARELLSPDEPTPTLAVPLFARWVTATWPLEAVKRTIQQIEPFADQLYRVAKKYYVDRAFPACEDALRKALAVRPSHYHARLMLGVVLADTHRATEAMRHLEEVAQFEDPTTIPDLTRAFLQVAKQQDGDGRIATYERVLAIDPSHEYSLAARARLLEGKAKKALRENRYEEAEATFRRLDVTDAAEKVSALRTQRRDLREAMNAARRCEAAGRWAEAVDIYRRLSSMWPDEEGLARSLARAVQEDSLQDLYARGISALRRKELQTARSVFNRIIEIAPQYREAVPYFLEAVRGVPLSELTAYAGALRFLRQAAPMPGKPSVGLPPEDRARNVFSGLPAGIQDGGRQLALNSLTALVGGTVIGGLLFILSLAGWFVISAVDYRSLTPGIYRTAVLRAAVVAAVGAVLCVWQVFRRRLNR